MIPEKWKIKRTFENAEMLNRWHNEHPLFKAQAREEATYIPDKNDYNGDFFYLDRKHGSENSKSEIKNQYTEITTEQFIEFVLNKKEICYEIY